MLFRLPSSRREAHFLQVCFHPPETFVYDFVRGCERNDGCATCWRSRGRTDMRTAG